MGAMTTCLRTVAVLAMAVALAQGAAAPSWAGDEELWQSVAKSGGGPLQVGEDIFEAYESPHPYPVSTSGDAQLVWSDVINYPKATYISPHFSRFELAEGDYVIVRSPDASRTWTFERFGKGDLGRSPEGFWGIHIPGETAIIELWSAGRDGAYGYTIDRYARGFTPEEMGTAGPEALCGAGDLRAVAGGRTAHDRWQQRLHRVARRQRRPCDDQRALHRQPVLSVEYRF
jgi:lysyl endopeptidase